MSGNVLAVHAKGLRPPGALKIAVYQLPSECN